MELDYKLIGRRIAQRRKQLGFKQAVVEEKANIGYKYLSRIEHGVSIPSTEVIMRLAIALDTTPDAFLVGAVREEDAPRWKNIAQRLQGMSEEQLDLVESFVRWVSEREG